MKQRQTGLTLTLTKAHDLSHLVAQHELRIKGEWASFVPRYIKAHGKVSSPYDMIEWHESTRYVHDFDLSPDDVARLNTVVFKLTQQDWDNCVYPILDEWSLNLRFLMFCLSEANYQATGLSELFIDAHGYAERHSSAYQYRVQKLILNQKIEA